MKSLSTNLLAILLVALAKPAPVFAVELRVAVAANFAPTLHKMVATLQAATGHTALVTSGSTGKFFAQISQGAPFDVLLAADAETPRKLAQQGLAVASTQCTYAVGRLALYSAVAGRVDNHGVVLRSDTIGKLAIANLRLAPYGAAAEAMLQRLGLRDRLKPKLVIGENTAQTLQFAQSGNADLALVAWSQVIDLKGGSRWLVPADLHPPLVHDAIVLRPASMEGSRKTAAVAFLGWLVAAPQQSAIRAAGYGR